MDLRDLIKLAGIINPEVLNRIQPTAPEVDCGCSMEEAEGAGFERATTEPEEEIYDDPLASAGSTVDLSLRRYLKAKGDHVTVDEEVYPDYTVEDVNAAYSAFKEAKDYGPGKIGAIQKMLDKERDAKKAKIDQPAGITLSDWQAIAARREELMDAGMEPEEAQDQAAEEMGIDPEELVDWLDANDDLYEAEEGTYMKQWYNYSEDYAMLELYVDGKLVDKWDGYFGANETGNPLQVKFIEMAKENEVDPVGLKVIDGEDGDEGVFTSSGLKWNSNEATESLNDIKKLAGIAEADLDENAFNQAAAAAARAGKDSFEFNGKTYKTKMDKSTAHKLDDDVDMLRKLAGLAQ